MDGGIYDDKHCGYNCINIDAKKNAVDDNIVYSIYL
jgi:hypothetical protein